MVLLRLSAARRVQGALTGGGCALVAFGAGVTFGVGVGLIVAGVLAVAYGLLLVDDGGGR